MKYIEALILALLVTSCVKGPTGDPGADAIPPDIQVGPSTHCPSGGLDVTINGYTTVICNGMNGVDGIDGQNGHDGTNGQDGAPGTVIVMVKFCPGVTPHYPNSFPEWGIKIGTGIWAVYSANGGFLTQLLPGSYTTTGIGTNCNFTITTDGQVLH